MFYIRFFDGLDKFDYDSVHIIRLIALLSFWLVIILITNTFSRKVIYKIIINKGTKQISFELFKANDVVTINLSDLKRIHVNLYTTFFFDGKKLLYNTDQRDKKLIDFLKTQNVTWGFWGQWILRKKKDE